MTTLIVDDNFDKETTDVLTTNEYNDLMSLLNRLTESSVYIKRTIYIKTDEESVSDNSEVNPLSDKMDKFTYKELHRLTDLLAKLTNPVVCIRRPIEFVND